MCAKKSFGTKQGADRRASQIYQNSGVFLRSYLCDICDKYHLTHKILDIENKSQLIYSK